MATVLDVGGMTSAVIGSINNAGAQVAQGLMNFNPQMMEAKGKLDALSNQRQQMALELQQQQLTHAIRQSALDTEFKKQELDLQKYDTFNKIELAKQQFGLAQQQLQMQNEHFNKELDLKQQGLDLNRDQFASEAEYKQALIKQMSYSMDSSNPDNMLKLAQISKAFNTTPKAQSPQGKLAADLQSGVLSPELLSQMKTTFDPVTGQAITSFEGGNTGIQKEALIDQQKLDNKALQDIREASAAAIKDLGQFDTLEQSVQQFGKTAPVLGAAKLQLAQVGSVLGIPSAQVTASAGENLRASGNLLALVNRKDLPGAMSDADRSFLLQSAPGLGNTQEGNIKLIAVGKAKAELTKQYSTFAEEFRNKTGSLNGLTNAWDKYVSATPVINKTKDSFTVNQPTRENLNQFLSKLPSQSDINATAIKYGITPEEVKRKLGY